MKTALFLGFLGVVLASCAAPARKWIRPMREKETWQDYNASFHIDEAACSAATSAKPRTDSSSGRDGKPEGGDLEPDNILDMGDKAAAKKRFSDCMMRKGWRQPDAQGN